MAFGAAEAGFRSRHRPNLGLDAAAQGFDPLAAQPLAKLLHARHGSPRLAEQAFALV